MPRHPTARCGRRAAAEARVDLAVAVAEVVRAVAGVALKGAVAGVALKGVAAGVVAGAVAGADGKRHLVYGLHAIEAVLEEAPDRLLEFWAVDAREHTRARELRDRAAIMGLRVQLASPESLNKLVGNVTHQGVVAAVRPRKAWDEHELLAHVRATAKPLLLVLDGVTDPHNLGACLRTAAAAGVHALILPKDRSATVDGVVRKVAAGAAEIVGVASVTNLARTLDALKGSGLWIVGTDGKAEQTLYTVDLDRPLAVVMGGESGGMRRLTRERCDFVVRIPISPQMESLNVSVAAGVALFEALRQRSP